MLFYRYRKLVSIAAGAFDQYTTAVDGGHAPLTALTVTVTSVAQTLVQVGYQDGGGANTPRYTRLCAPGTTVLSFPNYVNDGSQLVWVGVTNLGSGASDVYLDLEATEA